MGTRKAEKCLRETVRPHKCSPGAVTGVIAPRRASSAKPPPRSNSGCAWSPGLELPVGPGRRWRRRQAEKRCRHRGLALTPGCGPPKQSSAQQAEQRRRRRQAEKCCRRCRNGCLWRGHRSQRTPWRCAMAFPHAIVAKLSSVSEGRRRGKVKSVSESTGTQSSGAAGTRRNQAAFRPTGGGHGFEPNQLV